MIYTHLTNNVVDKIESPLDKLVNNAKKIKIYKNSSTVKNGYI